jgi:peptide alpha-N-acetyltransferase
MDLRAHYHNKEKVDIIENTFQTYLQNLEKHSRLSEDSSDKTEDPDVIMWTKFYLAQHFEHLGQIGRALELIEEVLQHTPTLVEAYLVKGKILKSSGDYESASEAVDKGRSLDLADRYLNNECAKYQFRADQIDQAMKSLGMFTKEGEDPAAYLTDMQCMWYENAIAGSYIRSNEFGKAMKKLIMTQKHFDDIVDDQLDFHSYCHRKVTLRSYISMLRYEDHLYGHKFYVRAMKKLLSCYITLHDNPKAAKGDDEEAALGKYLLFPSSSHTIYSLYDS